ncbi:MAG: EAL domain-containing protein [Nitrosomonadales bacterium]|nr:EAL domain-containing protein [Nitrosomonadales bacterium]
MYLTPSFLSIRRKIVFLAGLVLAVTGGLLIWLQYQTQMRQFDQERAAYRDRTQEMVGRLFQLQADRMQMLGRMLADLPKVREDMAAGRGGELPKDVEMLWSELNLGQGLSAVAFYDDIQRPLAAWGERLPSTLQAAQARAASIREVPSSWLECADGCNHQTVVPITQYGRFLGTVALTSSLEGLILDLRQLSGAEVAVFTGPVRQDDSPLAGMHLLFNSGGDGARAVLQAATSGTWHNGYFQSARLGQVRQVMFSSVPLRNESPVHLAFVTDVTREVEAINSSVQRSLAWGGVVLVAAMLLLYVLLRPTMQRLREIADVLPLLGQERFDEVRQRHALRKRAKVLDEMDELGELAITLTERLELLRSESLEHASSLAAQTSLMERERDFVSGLLNTAPVLILSYGLDGRIYLANDYAMQTCGLPREDVMGENFAELFLAAELRHAYGIEMAGMVTGRVRHSESSMMRPDHSVRNLVWFHSRLVSEEGEPAVFLSVGMDVTELRRTEHRLHSLTEHDAVTGLYNRRAFKRELDTLLANGTRGVILVCDIDQFKAVNEANGHEAGDAVLTACAAHIRELSPVACLSARLGSDDFALVFADLSAADAIILARQLNQVIARQSGLQHLSTCVGVAVFPDHGADADSLLGSVQLALTQARAKGYGSWHLYSAEDPYREAAGRQTYWCGEVERALETDGFQMYFQPILNLRNGKVSHYEALVRMNGLGDAVISPESFIDVAESSGLVRRIDLWVIDAVVAFVAQHAGTKVAVNLSGRSFDDETVVDAMRVALARYDVGGERLLIEITETAALANFANAINVMGALRGLGCSLGLDDFGVGYSSFQYLRELPVDFVKIDGSFIRGLATNQDDRVFVKALTEVVQGFGKLTVAEFVEDEVVLGILREIGVDFVQGNLIGSPSPHLLSSQGELI